MTPPLWWLVILLMDRCGSLCLSVCPCVCHKFVSATSLKQASHFYETSFIDETSYVLVHITMKFQSPHFYGSFAIKDIIHMCILGGETCFCVQKQLLVFHMILKGIFKIASYEQCTNSNVSLEDNREIIGVKMITDPSSTLLCKILCPHLPIYM